MSTNKRVSSAGNPPRSEASRNEERRWREENSTDTPNYKMLHPKWNDYRSLVATGDGDTRFKTDLLQQLVILAVACPRPVLYPISVVGADVLAIPVIGDQGSGVASLGAGDKGDSVA